jgi:hypothetical protein
MRSYIAPVLLEPETLVGLLDAVEELASIAHLRDGRGLVERRAYKILSRIHTQANHKALADTFGLPQ